MRIWFCILAAICVGRVAWEIAMTNLPNVTNGHGQPGFGMAIAWVIAVIVGSIFFTILHDRDMP
jgi:hypothetical protein